MDPSALVSVLSDGASAAAGAGAAAGLTDAVKTGIVDAYTACKKAIRTRFGNDDDAKEKLSQLEVAPRDADIQKALATFLEKYAVGDDPGVVQAAESLHATLTRIEGGALRTGDISGNTIQADRGGVAAGAISGGVSAGYTGTEAEPDPR